MPLFRMRVLPVCLSLVFTGFAALTPAQNLPATPHTPDLLGIYPGMPANEARAMLQKHSTTVYVKTGSPPESGFGLAITDPKNPDLINVDLTREPNDPNVWLITRSWVYYPGAGGPGLSQEALLTALHQKYGKETLTWDRGGGGLFLYWIFDQSGKLQGAADPTLQGCDGNDFVTYISSGPPQAPNDIQKACYRSFYAVMAGLNRGGQLLNS